MFPSQRAPTPPGEILAEEFLAPLGMSQTELAQRMGVPVQRINLLINGKRGITAETAILLGQVFDTSAEFWMNLQAQHDLWLAARSLKKAARAARPLKRSRAREAAGKRS